MNTAAPVSGPTALAAGYYVCHYCGTLTHGHDEQPDPVCCEYCGVRLHGRKPDSIHRTWALLMAAGILYFPANMLPILETRTIFGVSEDTLLSGVVYLWVSGSWPLSVVVFVASVLVPLVKMLALAYLNFSVQRRMTARAMERARLYRGIELVGRWSMLDVFVVAMLAALVNLDPLAVMRPGPAALYFSGVVILTMLAAMSFDSRLIWDPLSETESRGG